MRAAGDILQRSPASHNPFHGIRDNFPPFAGAFDAAAVPAPGPAA
eukprot:SAG22_NODE_9736_length_572_cov_3.167019_1_plen_44_part_10